MMDDRRIGHGLALLADEAQPPAVDVDRVIATAKARSRNRTLASATAVVGVVAVAGVLTMIVGSTAPAPTTPPAQQTSTASTEATNDPAFDKRARQLTDAISPIMGSIAKPRVQISGLNHGQQGVGVPVFQGVELGGHTAYLGVVDVTVDSVGAQLKVWVVAAPEGLGIDVPAGTPHGPCALSRPGCASDTLSDGTVVRVLNTEELYVIFARSPDGTVVEVSVESMSGLPTLASLLELDKLGLIVEAITY